MSALISHLIPNTYTGLNLPPEPPNPQTADYLGAPLSSYLFGRYWSVTIGSQGQTGVTYTQLRTEFEIEKTIGSTSNKAKIKLYNLTDQDRQRFVKYQLLTLIAGYTGNFGVLFSGQISSRVTNERKGGDTATIFECGDGELPLYMNVFDKSYGAGTSNIQVINDLVGALGLPLGTVSGVVQKTYPRGIHITGSVKHNLDVILGSMGCEWSVQNGVVYIAAKGSSNGQTAILITAQNAVLGTPTNDAGGDNIISFSTLLDPKLICGRPVQMDTATVKGLYAVKTARFEGDSHGDSWKVTCEASPVASTSPLLQNKGGKIQ